MCVGSGERPSCSCRCWGGRPGAVKQGQAWTSDAGQGGQGHKSGTPLGGAAIGTGESRGGVCNVPASMPRLGDRGTLGVCELGGSQHDYPHFRRQQEVYGRVPKITLEWGHLLGLAELSDSSHTHSCGLGGYPAKGRGAGSRVQEGSPHGASNCPLPGEEWPVLTPPSNGV